MAEVASSALWRLIEDSHFWKSIEPTLERVVLDPKYHDALTLVKGMRNGIVYGTKVRFPHALVMIFLFRHGPFRQKCWLILKATRQHARNLALFALIYKSSMLVLARAKSGKVHRWDPFIAGLLGGYTVFGRSIHSSVAQQIVIYVFARVCLATAKLAVQPHIAVEESAVYAAHHSGWGLLDQWPAGREAVRQHGWTAFATLSWAAVMWLFKWHPEVVQPSLRSSMNYIYVKSDHWDSLKTFLWHNE